MSKDKTKDGEGKVSNKLMGKLQKLEQARDTEIREKVGTESRAYMGDPALNWATGGWATGRANLLYGPSGSGKSTLALMGAAALQQRTKGWVLIFDSEYAYPSHTESDEAGALTPDAKRARARLERFGLDPDLVYRRSSNKVDELFESLGDFEKELQKKPGKDEDPFRVSAIIVDSWGGIQNESAGTKIAEGEVAAAGNSFGGNAKTIGPIIQTLLRIGAEHGVTSFYVQHCIQNMEQYGPRWKLIGGEKLKYLVHQTLFVESIAAKDAALMDGDRATTDVNKDEGVKVGKKIRGRCEKSRFVVEGRKCEFWMNFQDARFALPAVSLFDLAMGLGVIAHPVVAEKNKDGSVKKGDDGQPVMKSQDAYYEYPVGAATPTKWHGRAATVDALATNQDLFNKVREACEACGKISSIGNVAVGAEGDPS